MRSRATFGNLAIILFIVAQAADGVLTFVGIKSLGLHMEGNPVLGWLMEETGNSCGLLIAKGVAIFLGSMLHFSQVDRAVMTLAVFYLVIAVLPWVCILFYF